MSEHIAQKLHRLAVFCRSIRRRYSPPCSTKLMQSLGSVHTHIHTHWGSGTHTHIHIPVLLQLLGNILTPFSLISVFQFLSVTCQTPLRGLYLPSVLVCSTLLLFKSPSSYDDSSPLFPFPFTHLFLTYSTKV